MKRVAVAAIADRHSVLIDSKLFTLTRARYLEVTCNRRTINRVYIYCHSDGRACDSRLFCENVNLS